MLNEITLPDDYTGTLAQENAVIQAINENFAAIEDMMRELPAETLSFDKHIVDFEGYQLDLYFTENKTHAKITAVNDMLIIEIADKTIRIDANGDIV
jgi:hypothetical protein